MNRLAFLPAALTLLLAQAAPAPREERIAETRPELNFLYVIPPEAASIPELRLALVNDARTELAEARASAAAEGRGKRLGPDEVEQIWTVTADTPDLLAIVSTPSTYQDGAAHGYFGYESLIWSRSEKRRLGLAELFTDRVAGTAALMAVLCDELERVRAEQAREEGDAPPAPMRCPDAETTAISPVAAPGRRIAAFRMMLSGEETPHGYAGGSVEAEVPVTPALRAHIRSDLRASFDAPRKSGQ